MLEASVSVRKESAIQTRSTEVWCGGISSQKLSELEIREQCQIEISNKFAAVESLNVSEGLSRAWESTKGNTKTSAKEILILYGL